MSNERNLRAWNNPEAEAAVLGSMMISPDKAADGLRLLSETDFWDERNRAVLHDMRLLHARNAPIDLIGLMEYGHDVEFIAALTDRVATAQVFTHYANVVKALSGKRAIAMACDNIKHELENTVTDNLMDIRAMAMAKFDVAVPELTSRDTSIMAIVDRTMDEMDRDVNGEGTRTKWGMRDLDYHTGGLWPAELSLIAASPGAGKTAFALQTALHAARNGKYVEFMSLEMNESQICRRLLCQISGVDSDKIRNTSQMSSDEWASVGRAGSELAKYKLHVDATSTTIQDVFDTCRRKREKGKLDLVVVDYLQLMTSSKKAESRLQEVNTISRTLKVMSRDLQIPVIALSQMNREGQRSGKEPALYDLRESGALEQDADNVIFLWNPNPDGTQGASIVSLYLLVAKQRSGKTGRIWVDFNMPKMKFCGRER